MKLQNMVIYIKDFFLMVKNMEEVGLFVMMNIMMVNLKMENDMDMEYHNMLKDLDQKVILEVDDYLEKELDSYQMEQFLKQLL